MKNSYSNIYSFNKKTLRKTINYLKNSDVVGLPTETVYGLGGNAYSISSIKKIFKLKGRPKSNPLIIHYFDLNDAMKDIIVNRYFIKLYEKLCPGPVTFVLRKKISSKIHPLSLAKLKTVAVRFPKHKVVRSILKEISFPLAMPSANTSSNLSPVNAKDVFDEFKHKVRFILDGGKSRVGIESTVIDLTGSPKILRPGVIDKNMLEKILRTSIEENKSKTLKSPGMMRKHYYPGIPVLIDQKKYIKDSAYLYLGKKYKQRKNFFSLSEDSDLDEAASKLYKTFRLVKKKGYKRIQISEIPNKGSGIAINDRIKRASKF